MWGVWGMGCGAVVVVVVAVVVVGKKQGVVCGWNAEVVAARRWRRWRGNGGLGWDELGAYGL